MIYLAEKWIKKKLFNCQTCGQCILSHTKMLCPMNCPKGLRNGPCGGTLNGKCEVMPDIDCTWTRIENKKDKHSNTIHLPLNKKLLNTSSYINLINGKDKDTRLPKAVSESRELTATSLLAQKMHRGEFVVTFEIHSPKTKNGLQRVHQTMEKITEYVDAVNTTTNAGGKRSLHSVETASVIQQYGVEGVIQYCGRDHDSLDFLKEMEKALSKGFKNFLLLTGDWLPQNERNLNQKFWFPMDSSQMFYYANEQLSNYKDKFGIVPFLGAASNPFSTPLINSVNRLALKRNSGARFSQTQAITDAKGFETWYKHVREGRENEPKLVIPSVPLVGNLKLFNVLKKLPGVSISKEFEERIVKTNNIAQAGLDWALDMIKQLKKYDAAGVHLMNFGMPIDKIVTCLQVIRKEHCLNLVSQKS